MVPLSSHKWISIRTIQVWLMCWWHSPRGHWDYYENHSEAAYLPPLKFLEEFRIKRYNSGSMIDMTPYWCAGISSTTTCPFCSIWTMTLLVERLSSLKVAVVTPCRGSVWCFLLIGCSLMLVSQWLVPNILCQPTSTLNDFTHWTTSSCWTYTQWKLHQKSTSVC